MSKDKKDISFKKFLEGNDYNGGIRYKRDDLYDVKEVKLPKKPVQKKKVTYTTQKEFDFLKYYGIVEYYAVKVMFKGDVTFKELKLLFFIYSEPPFTFKDFKDYTELVGWKTNRIREWIKKGIIVEHKVKDYKLNGKRNAKMYALSKSTKRKIRAIYDKLLLRYKITEHKTHNPLFRENSRTYQEKRYAKKIKQMNDGEYGKRKDEDDWDDLNSLSFMEFVENHNKDNHETLPDFKAAEDKYENEIKTKKEE